MQATRLKALPEIIKNIVDSTMKRLIKRSVGGKFDAKIDNEAIKVVLGLDFGSHTCQQKTMYRPPAYKFHITDIIRPFGNRVSTWMESGHPNPKP